MRQRRFKPRVRQLHEDRPASDAKPIDPVKARERTMQRAVKLLAAKPRSIEELRERLLESKFADVEIVEAVISKLVEYGYLNDERYAFGYASYQVRQRPIGRQKLRRDLALKKVNREIADEAIKLVFEETSEEDLIDRAIVKRLRSRGRPHTRSETKSLIDHLLRQGFSFELVIQKVRALSAASIDDEPV